MKRSARSIILTILCGAMTAAAASCANGVTYPVTVDGEQFRAGMYILEQQTALSEAVSKLSEEQPDLDTTAEDFDYFKQTVEGKSFDDWIKDTALEKCREYVAVERLFDQYGLTLSADEVNEINTNVKQLWTEENQYAQYYYGVSIIGEYYEKFGIGEQSFKDIQLNSRKRSDLFAFLYGEGGQLAATQDEINTSLQNDYLALNYFVYELENGDGAQSYADSIASGKSYEEVYRDYSQAKSDEDAAKAAEEAAAAETENDEETEDAAEEFDEGDELDDGGETADDTTTQPTVIETAEKDSLIRILAKSSGTPSEEFISQASAMNAGDVKVITVENDSSTITYVVQKLDILSLPEKTADTIATIRSDLKTDEYSDMLKTTGAGYTLTTDSSIDLYKAKKLMES